MRADRAVAAAQTMSRLAQAFAEAGSGLSVTPVIAPARRRHPGRRPGWAQNKSFVTRADRL